MVEVKRRQGSVRLCDEDDDDEHRVREWEDGLPSLADLISLSQCLISPQLASAFSIASPSPAPVRSSADVALASRAAFSSLCGTHPDPSPHSQVQMQRLLSANDEHGNLLDDRRSEEKAKLCIAMAPRDSFCNDSASLADPSSKKNPDLSVRKTDDNKPPPPEDAPYLERLGDVPPGRFAGVEAEANPRLLAPAQECQGMFQSPGDGAACMSERNIDCGEGEGCEESNVRHRYSLEGSSDINRRVDVDVEAEEAESTPSPAENPNGESAARTLKRPRLVWTPELHKRFVDAVTHLGLRTAVPKTIMQLMNVEGLTRENVASHLQKYRLYLKRMQQGIPGEGPTASDHIFASAPLPVNLATSGRFPPGVSAHLQDINQVPFLPVSINQGHIAGMVPGPLPPMDPYSYAAFARSAHRGAQQGDVPDVHRWRQHQGDPNHSSLKK